MVLAICNICASHAAQLDLEICPQIVHTEPSAIPTTFARRKPIDDLVNNPDISQNYYQPVCASSFFLAIRVAGCTDLNN